MSRIVTQSGVELFYKSWGSGRPIVLIHGWPLTSDSWDAVALPLAEAGYRTIAYDRRGFGRSDQPWAGYDYDTLADDLADVMNILELQNATLVGFSMGGGEVARYMGRHAGEGVTSAVLISSIVPLMLQRDDNPKGVERAVFDDMQRSLERDRPAFYAEFFKNFYGVGPDKNPVSEPWLEWTRSLAMQASLKATQACVEAFATTDFRDDLSAFNVPTLIIHGTADEIVPIEVSSRAAAEAIPHARLLEYEDGPHGLFATHTDRLIADLKSFLGEND